MTKKNCITAAPREYVGSAAYPVKRNPSLSVSIASAFSAKSWPKIRARRPCKALNKSPLSGSTRNIRRVSPCDTSRRANPIEGSAIARRLITSLTAWVSARSVRMNLSRAGVAKNKSRNSTTVPAFRAAGFTSDIAPPESEIWAPSNPAARDVIVKRPTAPSDGRASPRNPKLFMFKRSVPSIFEVACRDKANGKSSADMPHPSSVTRINVLPPSAISTEMRRAPASIAFSTSSFTADAGRSTTSPAAIRLIAASSSCRMTGRVSPILGFDWLMILCLACFLAILLFFAA